jgi:hypothetical protein
MRFIGSPSVFLGVGRPGRECEPGTDRRPWRAIVKVKLEN